MSREGPFGTNCAACGKQLSWNGVNYIDQSPFFEEDEPVEDVLAAFERGDKSVTSPSDCAHTETFVDDMESKRCVTCCKVLSSKGTSFTNLPPRVPKFSYEWMYRVKDLREILDKLPGDMPVVLSKDGEGNEYKLLVAHNETYRVTEEHRGRHIEIVGKDHAADDDMIEGCDHKDCRYATGEPVLVLWPA